MISHIHLGTNDLPAAKEFYSPLMAELGWRLRFYEPDKGWAGWQPEQADRPLLLVGVPFDGHHASPGNGNMVALLARDRATVDRCHRLAIENGGANEGDPGLRPHYHANFYGAYFRDLEGNKICICCHSEG